MTGRYWLSLVYYWGIPLVVIILVVRLAKRNMKIIDEYYKKSWANQEEMIALLKEIRDLLKK
jgi:large-conductance mechanosensitive channel